MPKSLVGANLTGLTDYDRGLLFADAMKTHRKWSSAARPWDMISPELDENGWPKADCGAVILADAVYASGTYKFSCDGKVGEIKPNSSPVKVTNIVYAAAKNRTTADITLNAPDPAKDTQMFLAFTGTEGGFRNAKMMRPGYKEGDIFTREIIKCIEPLGAIRFMDYFHTNHSEISTWDTRSKITDSSWSEKGGPYEYAFELLRVTGKDGWINVPHLADQDHIDRLAVMAKALLPANCNLYVEYSNEVWNWQFTQAKWNLDQSRLDKDKYDLGAIIKDDNGLRWSHYALKSYQIAAAFRKVFGNDSRIRPILATQNGWQDGLDCGLKYIEAKFGPPKNFFYGCAIAPYFGNIDAFMKRTDLTVESFFGPYETVDSKGVPFSGQSYMMDRAGSTRSKGPLRLIETAKKYGIRPICYEGGVDFGQHNICVPEKTAAQYDPRMGEAVEAYLNNWFNAGGKEFFWFTLSSKYKKWGYWGSTEHPSRLDVPKYKALTKVAAERPSDGSTPDSSSSSSKPQDSSSSSKPQDSSSSNTPKPTKDVKKVAIYSKSGKLKMVLHDDDIKIGVVYKNGKGKRIL